MQFPKAIVEVLKTMKRWCYKHLPCLASRDKFHFVEDYEKLVRALIRKYPLDEAMSRAVGGEYQKFGQIEAALLVRLGLRDGMKLVDLGCGSGRLATALSTKFTLSYTGIDIIRRLLDYAKSKAPNYEFICHRELSIPQPDASADMVCAFSLFTHLLHAETYIYLEECKRILRPGGRVVFSFLEFTEPYHWGVFLETKEATREKNLSHLNTFIERCAIAEWAGRLGFVVDEFISGTEPVFGECNFGQSVAVLSKPI